MISENTNKPTTSQPSYFRYIILAIVFLSLTCLLYLGFRQDSQLTYAAQSTVFAVGMGALLAGLATLLLSVQMDDVPQKPRKWWFFPLMSALLGLGGMSLAYVYLGVWPLGERSVMIVDMHHQYAPLLAQLRDMLVHGGNAQYSFEVGLGASFLPLFGYYLASPFNLLLVFFPESLLNEGILVITLLKSTLTAGFFALCVQYIFRRRDMSVMIVSVMYSLMMYLLAYSWDIMWLDCVMVLPLVVMSFEKLMREGRYLPYVLSLGYALYANYYIGFMLCLFLVLYYGYYVLRRERPGTASRSFGRFAVGSLLGGGLSMFLLVPVYISLAHTSAAGGSLPDIANNFDMFDLLGRHLYETTPTIRSGNLPNIYCGMLAVVLLPLFATLKSIPLRRRLAGMGLLAVMAASCVINQMDLIWHGLHSPNDLPYRFSFLYSFVLLLLAYETLVHIREITPKQIGGTVAGLLGYLVLQEKFGGDDYDFNTIYVSLLLVVVYAVVIALISRRRMEVRPGYALLLLIVTAEMTLNASSTFRTLQSNEYFTARRDYVANDITEAIRRTVARTETIGDDAAKGSFYRMEFLPRRTTVDTALFDYRGMTVFASSSPQYLTQFMGYLGYAVNGVNSHLYKSFVPATDSLLGIKYVLLDSETSQQLADNPYLKYLDQVTYNSVTYSIYENTEALPLGYFVDSSVEYYTPAKYDPIVSQNSLYTSMLGTTADLYTYSGLSVQNGSEDIASVNGSSNFNINASGSQSTASFTATLAKAGQTVVYVDCRAADSIQVSASNGSSWSVTTHEPYMINAGNWQEGDEITITVTSDESCTGNIYVATLNETELNNALNTLSANPLTITSFSDTHFEGSATAPRDGVIFTTIPYEKGWTVKVDGRKVETFAGAEAMVAFRVTSGSHTVTIEYSTPGLGVGIAISLLSLALLVLLILFIRKFVDGDDPDDNEFKALFRLLAPRKPQEPAADSEEISAVPLSDLAAGAQEDAEAPASNDGGEEPAVPPALPEDVTPPSADQGSEIP